MPEESKTGIARSSAGPANGAPTWLGRNQSFIRAICLILTYVSAMAFLVAILLLGAFTLLIGILLGIFIASILIVILLRRLPRAGS
jgi:MFS superfamily sulfate permease-like transporter